MKKTNGDIHMEDAIGSDRDGNTITVLDIIKSDENSVPDEVELKESIIRLKAAMRDVLDVREREIISLRYGLSDGKEVTQREIAAMLGISRSYVSRIEKKALSKLYDRLK